MLVLYELLKPGKNPQFLCRHRPVGNYKESARLGRSLCIPAPLLYPVPLRLLLLPQSVHLAVRHRKQPST